MNRETVDCPVCGMKAGEPCDFLGAEPWMTKEDGEERRVVHAGRYARTLPVDEQGAFWETAVESYLSTALTEAGLAALKDGAS